LRTVRQNGVAIRFPERESTDSHASAITGSE
jgi:hypothetical protein